MVWTRGAQGWLPCAGRRVTIDSLVLVVCGLLTGGPGHCTYQRRVPYREGRSCRAVPADSRRAGTPVAARRPGAGVTRDARRDGPGRVVSSRPGPTVRRARRPRSTLVHHDPTSRRSSPASRRRLTTATTKRLPAAASVSTAAWGPRSVAGPPRAPNGPQVSALSILMC